MVQSTSPLFARQSYWCIVETVKQAGLRIYPYHLYVPSFGEWGFVIGSFASLMSRRSNCPTGLRFLSTTNVRGDVRFSRWTCSQSRRNRII